MQTHADPAAATTRRRRRRAVITVGVATATSLLVSALMAGGLIPIPGAQADPAGMPSNGAESTASVDAAGSNTDAASQVTVASWDEYVDEDNGDEFNTWLLAHQGQVVWIDASLRGEWNDMGVDGALAVGRSESVSWHTAVTISPSSSGRPGYDRGIYYASLNGYYMVEPADHFQTVGFLHYLQALDTAEAITLASTEVTLEPPATHTDAATSPPAVGALRVGMTYEEAVATGQTTVGYSDMHQRDTLRPTSDGAYVGTSATHITSFTIKKPGWTTPEGIGVGSSVSDLFVAYPDAWFSPEHQDFVMAPQGGWGYQFYLTNGAVSTIAFGEGLGHEVIWHS